MTGRRRLLYAAGALMFFDAALGFGYYGGSTASDIAVAVIQAFVVALGVGMIQLGRSL